MGCADSQDGDCYKCWHCWDYDDDELEDDDDEVDKDCDALHHDHDWDDDEVRCLHNDVPSPSKGDGRRRFAQLFGASGGTEGVERLHLPMSLIAEHAGLSLEGQHCSFRSCGLWMTFDKIPMHW